MAGVPERDQARHIVYRAWHFRGWRSSGGRESHRILLTFEQGLGRDVEVGAWTLPETTTAVTASSNDCEHVSQSGWLFAAGRTLVGCIMMTKYD